MKLNKYKKDFIVIGSILLGALILIIFISIFKKPGTYVVIEQNKEIIGTYKLSENRQIKIETDDGKYNLIVIEDGKVYMKEASCPNHECIDMGKKSNTNQYIACLPNKVIVTIKGENYEVDVVS